jgi:hypothetical protein
MTMNQLFKISRMPDYIKYTFFDVYSRKAPTLNFDLLFTMILCMFLVAVAFPKSKTFHSISI